ncbi:protein mono-ADP-ribosyltransferase PARP14-like [Ylistrum balloti]|uniref:protein mono-ADP-ribosyltransferase PARP14-like n=1 Tax=Ylistrum balloti TaxID=509963 RepID=UPI002905E026|nr:protein mono-ADP-ribosyltransferase PARP14-like [Ylistrum balloti]
MKSTGIAVTITDPGTLMPCDMIIHINAEEKKTSWKSKFLMAMDKANQKSAKSVAFPALGTALSSSPEKTASSFVDALIEFIGQDPDSVTEVHMVVFEQPMYQKFISTMQATFQQHQKKSDSWFHNLWGRKSTKFEWNPKINILHRDLSRFPIMVYGSNLRKIADAISDLESVIEKNFREKIFQEDIIKSFTKSQEQQINDLAQAHGIEVKVETRIGRIRLNGLLENISDASDELNKLIRDCEKRKMKEQEAALIGDMVQWHFMLVTGVGEKLEEYPPDINALLEKAFKGQKDQVKFADNARNMYVVDFRTLEEFPENDPVDRVKVIRKCKMADTTFEAPSDWSSVNDKDNLSVVVIPQSDPTFTKVQKQFLASVGSKTVIKIERIQNRTLYQQYIAKKRLVDTENAHISENEKMLWHGTAAETVDSINSHGFNRSYCGKNATAFGDGVYFAVNANYSASTTYARPDLNNHQRMYLCKVITGEFTQGKRGMRVPPLKKAPHILYDSVVDTPANPGMYIIFNDTQAYPEYLITFQ